MVMTNTSAVTISSMLFLSFFFSVSLFLLPTSLMNTGIRRCVATNAMTIQHTSVASAANHAWSRGAAKVLGMIPKNLL